MSNDSEKSHLSQADSQPDYTDQKTADVAPQVWRDSDGTIRLPLSKCAIVLLNISFLGLNMMFLVLSVEVVPAQIESMSGSKNKGIMFGGMVAGGAVLTFITGPLIGMKSDRLVCKYGKRRPIMVVSTVGLCIGLLGMAFSAPKVSFGGYTRHLKASNDNSGTCQIDLEIERCRYIDYRPPDTTRMPTVVVRNVPDYEGHLAAFIPFYLMVMVSHVCISTPYSALIADKSHPQQRGLSSGVMGGMILLGNICGAALGMFLTNLGVIGVYGIVILIVMVCIATTVVAIGEKPSAKEHEALECKDLILAYWSPLKDHDFRWVFITRFLMQQGITTVIGFLEYWLGDMVNLPYCWNPAKGVSIMLIPLLISAAVSSVMFGLLSDKIGQRKPLIVVASIVMSICAGILACLRGHYAFYVAISVATIFGLSFGSYQAVDFALVMDVLPDIRDVSRDIAVWQQAMVLPQALAVPIGGIILDSFQHVNCHIGLGYIILFCVTAVYFMLSGIFVVKIKNVK